MDPPPDYDPGITDPPPDYEPEAPGEESKYQCIIECIFDDLHMQVDHRDVAFYEVEHHGTAIMAARSFVKGEVIFLDRAVCLVDEDLLDSTAPDSIARIRDCLSHLPTRNKKSLDNFCGGDILNLSPELLLRILNAVPIAVQFPILEDRREDAWSKIITTKPYGGKHTPWCAPLLIWTERLFTHSCDPNAFVVPSSHFEKNWDFFIVATRDIKPGEAILINHLKNPWRSSSRQRHMEDKQKGINGRHAIVCSLCMATGSEKDDHDRNRQRIVDLCCEACEGGDTTKYSVFKTLRKAEEAFQLLSIEGITTMATPFVFCSASIAMARDGDTLHQHELAYWGIESAASILGIHHSILRNPRFFGINEEWDVNFETTWNKLIGRVEHDLRQPVVPTYPPWLWVQNHVSSDLRDDVYFPTFNDLPSEGSYPDLSGTAQSPDRHWIFLGEVAKSTNHKKDTIRCVDKNTKRFQLPVIGLSRDELQKLKPRKVVMFLYQTRLRTGPDSTGPFRIFPVLPGQYEMLPVSSLARLLQLSDTLKAHTTTIEQVTTARESTTTVDDKKMKGEELFERFKGPCFGCSKVSDNLIKCPDCKRVFFCTKECAGATHGKRKKFEADCKLLQKRGIKQLFATDWAIFRSTIEGKGLNIGT